MDPVSFAIAAVPLSLYLAALGAINLRRRPSVVSGTQDVVALAAAVSGLAVVGPMNLFLPEAAVARMGAVAWLLLLGLYTLCVVLYTLVARPRLVIFNLSSERLRAVLQRVAERLDGDSRVAGDAVQLPQLSVQFHVDAAPAMRSAALVATSDQQSHSGWQRLQRELGTALQEVEVNPNPRGFTMLAIAAGLVGWPLVQLLQLPVKDVAQRLMDMLRL